MPKISSSEVAAQTRRARRTHVGRRRAATSNGDTSLASFDQPSPGAGRVSPSGLPVISSPTLLRSPRITCTVTTPLLSVAPVPIAAPVAPALSVAPVAPALPVAPVAPAPPDIISLTPGGNAWWKLGGAAPLPLENVSVSSQRFWAPAGLLTHGPVINTLRSLAHVANAQLLCGLLTKANLQVMKREISLFGTAFASLSAPTLEQAEAMNHMMDMVAQLHRHAALHTLVGIGTLAHKMAILTMLRGMGIALADIRMEGLSLLHIACIVAMPSGDREALIRYLKGAGVDSAGVSETGLTPLHCLAAQPDSVAAMEVLMDWDGAFRVRINARTDAGETPLYFAYATQPDNTEGTSWLLGRGAVALERTNHGDSALHAVLRHGDHPEVVRDLLSRGLSVFTQCSEGVSPSTLCRTLRRANTFLVMYDACSPSTVSRLQRPYLGSTPATAVPPMGPMIPI